MVVESRSVIRNAKNARGLGRDRAPSPPFPSRARLIFALLVLTRSHYTIWEPGTCYLFSIYGTFEPFTWWQRFPILNITLKGVKFGLFSLTKNWSRVLLQQKYKACYFFYSLWYLRTSAGTKIICGTSQETPLPHLTHINTREVFVIGYRRGLLALYETFEAFTWWQRFPILRLGCPVSIK